jgi:hypothetical protein
MYKDLYDKLDADAFGPYDALKILIGEKAARFFCHRDRLDLSPRPASLPSRSRRPERVFIDLS